MSRLTEAQHKWFDAHPEYAPIGPPRAGVRFRALGTLYADGRFETSGSVIRLEAGCVGVGIPEPTDEK